ncbi:hypothetical protein M885DRAFT_615827 [Pelagophyceae sp. CCMP2097]|nr:hypothetical protein M885DRAFT_615827 [Pelagophyceae sp. CCMP2097]
MERRGWVPGDRLGAGWCVWRAFACDAATKWMFEEGADGLALWYFRWLVYTISMSHRLTDVAVESGRVVGVAAWEPVESESLAADARGMLMVAALFLRAGPRRASRILQLETGIENARARAKAPRATGHRLVLLATLPERRRRGIASELLRAGLRRADALGVACSLESTDAANMPLYRRHGFRAGLDGQTL